MNRILNLHRNVVGTGSGDPPPCSRALKKIDPEADGDADAKKDIMRERAAVWKRAINKR